MNTFKWILRIIACICFFAVGALILLDLYGLLYLNWDLAEVYFDMVSWAFTPLAIGILLFCFSLRQPNPKVSYWSLHVFLWLLGASIWFQQNQFFSTSLTGVITTPLSLWPWMLLPIIGSPLLGVLYKPVMYLLTKLMRPNLLQKAQVKDAQSDVEYEQQMQQYRG